MTQDKAVRMLYACVVGYMIGGQVRRNGGSVLHGVVLVVGVVIAVNLVGSLIHLLTR